ncbi:MAG: HAD family phosphatase [Saccharospirillaceae bacterium]|nr:HAD family phosphatase [Pseudomonadales bacterium]NRB78997.1 HAD family phosphatase [Saccharospirillaceae bacterium]
MIKVVVFDVAGVLLKETWIKTMQTLLNDNSLTKSDVFELWQKEECFHQYETGQLNTQQFVCLAKQALNIKLDDQTFSHIFNEMIVEPFKQSEQVLNTIKQNYKLAILSNTNPLHFEKIQSQYTIYQPCDYLFLSHQMGVMKPSKQIFNTMLDTLNCRPNEVMFFDDNQPNVAAARQLGIQSELITEPQMALDHLNLN